MADQHLSPAEASAQVLAASRFVAEIKEQYPERFQQWLEEGLFEQRRTSGELAPQALEIARVSQDDAALMRDLRRFRQREMARIAFRDLAGWAELDATLHELSDLADACCQAALEWADRALRLRHGVPRDAEGNEARPFILGMGKLGGRELNFSSDIDLVFGYTEPGETDGERVLSNEQYYIRLCQDLTRILSQRTEDGFVFRVDWMLRPFGASGPPAMHRDAMEQYYQLHGREWERYALIKARPVAGDLEAGRELLEALRPFVYRRYLDFNAIGALREMKRKIEDEIRRRRLKDNIKLGAGGIRELEFIVQAFQLVRGGHEKRLRDNRFRAVLRYLGKAGHLPPETAAELDEAYAFLRKTENAIQMYRDEQTHALPELPEARQALCAALGFPDWDAFMTRLDAVRGRVKQEFARVFAEAAARAPGSGLEAVLNSIWNGAVDAETALRALHAEGFKENPRAMLEALTGLRQTRLVKTLSETTVERLASLLPILLDEVRRYPQPETVALRVLKIVGAIAGRATYLTLLRESESVRHQLVQLCAASPWMSDFLAQSPVLLDQLLDVRSLYAPPSREEMRAELDELFLDVPAGDTEAGMDALRRFRQEVMLRIAAADLVQALPLVKVSDRLTWLAEVILQKTVSLVWAEQCAQYGEPKRAAGTSAQFGIIGYGKCGGIEMGYGSDLDLVFLHDCDELDAETVGGPRKIPNGVFFARLAQRIVHWLSTQTGVGRVYDVDLELRPSGNSGLLVTSLNGFADYQRSSAWTWEHQALSRARAVAGDPAIAEGFHKLRHEVLTRPRDAGKLRQEVLEMRARMRKHLERKKPGHFDLKQGEGGLTDIEFITQYLVLRDAHRYPALIEYSDNWRQTDALQAAGVLSSEQAQALIETYRQYRAWLHGRDLQQQDHLAEDALFAEERARVQHLWHKLLTIPTMRQA